MAGLRGEGLEQDWKDGRLKTNDEEIQLVDMAKFHPWPGIWRLYDDTKCIISINRQQKRDIGKTITLFYSYSMSLSNAVSVV